MLNRKIFIVQQGLGPKLVNRVNQKQNFNSLGLKGFQLRIVDQSLNVIAGNVVNSLLFRLNPADIFVQRSQALRILRRIETRQLGNFGAVGKIFINAFFKSNAERIPEFFIIVIIFAAVFKLFQQTVNGSRTNFGNQGRLLQHLAGNIQRQIGRINNPADKAQIRRHQFLNLIGNKHFIDIEFQTGFAIRLKQIIRGG